MEAGNTSIPQCVSSVTATRDDEESRLWAAWTGSRDREIRSALVDFYSDWVRFMARRIYMRVRIPGVEWADFVQLATIGLLESIDRFEPERGLRFTTYARHRVRGSVLNGLRQYRDGHPHERHASETRLAERTDSLNDTEQSGADLLTEIVEISVGLALGQLLDLKSLSGSNSDTDAYATVEGDMLMRDIARIVDGLPDREARIIRYHYYQQLPFMEIAELMGVTKGRISQLHRQALMRMRAELQSADGWDIRA